MKKMIIALTVLASLSAFADEAMKTEAAPAKSETATAMESKETTAADGSKTKVKKTKHKAKHEAPKTN